MRTRTTEGVTFRYPDEIGFAFNPCVILCHGENMTRMNVSISDGEKREDMTLDAFGGKCYTDMAEYVQAFFDTLNFGKLDYKKEKKSDVGKSLSFNIVAVLKDKEVRFAFEVYYVWGAMKIGGEEIYNGFRTFTWHKGYPFTFGVYCSGKGALMISQEGVADRFIQIPEQGVWNVPLSDDDGKHSYIVVTDSAGKFIEVTFDATFDVTFKQRSVSKDTRKALIKVEDDCETGYYLRWIDRHGFYCYELFKKGEEQRKSIAGSTFTRNDLTAYDDDYGYQGNTGLLQMKSRKDTIPICAPLVDDETWERLYDMATSPCVDLFAGYENGLPKWVSVNVVEGSHTKSRAVLQDFVCTIALQDVGVQKL